MSTSRQQGVPTYVAFNNTASGALTANTRKDILSIDHAVSAVKRVRITKIIASWLATTAVLGDLRVYMYKGVLQASAGNAITPVVKRTDDPAAETTVKSNPTITAATLIWAQQIGTVPATANSVIARQVLYEAPVNGRDDDFVLTEGAVEGFAIAIQSNAAINWTPFLEVHFTEE